MNPRIFIPILTGFNSAGFRAATFALKGLGSQMKLTAGSVAGAVGGMAATFVGAELTKFVNESVTEATKLQQTSVGLGRTFEQFTPKIAEFAKGASKIGLSTAEAQQALVQIGSTLRGSSFDVETAANTSTAILSRAADMAYIYGTTVADAVESIGAMFRGEYDPIEKYGVAIKQSQVDAEMLARGLNKLTGAQKTHAQQQVRVEMFFKATSRASGAYEQGLGTLGVVTNNLSAEFKNLEAAAGGPMLKPLVKMLQDVQNSLLKNEGGFVQFGIGLADVLSQLRPLTTALMNFIGQIMNLFGVIGSNSISIFGTWVTMLSAVINSLTWVLQVLNPILPTLLVIGSAWISAFSISWVIVTVSRVIDTVMISLSGYIASLQATAAAEGEVAVAADSMKLALARTGLGLILVVLGAIAAGFIAAGDATNYAKNAQEGYNDALQQIPAPNFSGGKFGQHSTKSTNPKPGEVFTDWNMDKEGNPRWFTQTWTGKKWTSPEYMKYTAPSVASAGSASKTKAESAAHKRRRLAKEAMKQALADYKDAVNKMYAEIRSSIEGMFDITQMGDSGARVINNMNKFLVKLRKFTQDVKQLAASGLNPTALQAIIQAGPAGAGRLASSLAAGGAGAISQINAGYSEISSLGGQIAEAGVGNAFSKGGNQYQIVVNAGLGDKNTIGKSIVDAIAAYEKTSGKAWRS